MGTGLGIIVAVVALVGAECGPDAASSDAGSTQPELGTFAATEASPDEPMLADAIGDNAADFEELDADDEAKILARKGIPMPPSQVRAEYLAWKNQLSPAVQREIDRHCREHGGDFQQVCNGIGPHAIPVPPSLMPLPRGTPDRSVSHEQWQASLTPVQRRYYKEYCNVGEADADMERGYSQLCGGTPIVLAFGDERIEYTAGGSFALAPGVSVSTDWPTATTPWLARDLDGDGQITHGGELFGSSTQLPDGSLARHGFAALAALDANADGVLDAADPAFATLLVWADRDGDRASTSSELTPLSEIVVSLSLRYHRAPLCDARGNCEGERSTMQWRTAEGTLRTGSVVDVYLRYR
jgi:hypothetical protein